MVGAWHDLIAANNEVDPGFVVNSVTLDQVRCLEMRVDCDAGSALIQGVACKTYALAEVTSAGVQDYLDEQGYVLGLEVDFKFTDNVTVGADIVYHRFDDVQNSAAWTIDMTTLQAHVVYRFQPFREAALPWFPRTPP